MPLNAWVAAALVQLQLVSGESSSRALLIDAGSGGSRLHVYFWSTNHNRGSSSSSSVIYPSSDESWTSVISPGIATYANDLRKVDEHLHSLLHETKKTLSSEIHSWASYRLYFKATGGMREIPVHNREAIMTRVRAYLSNTTLCPFYFQPEYARVISGEEEGVFSWMATNFLLGTLELMNLNGIGESSSNSTYGSLDLGGASSQITFFLPSQDISENLFRMQLNAQLHWNLYTKSFLQFGHESALKRYLTHSASFANFNVAPAVMPTALTFCFHAGYSEYVNYPFPVVLRTGARIGDVPVELTGPAAPTFDQSQRCRESLQPLMLKELNHFCLDVFHGQCSIGAAYQPSLPPPGDVRARFIGMSSYRYAWEFLLMPETATLRQFRAKADYICSLSFSEILMYYSTNGFNLIETSSAGDFLPYFCFQSSYILVLLQGRFTFTAHL